MSFKRNLRKLTSEKQIYTLENLPSHLADQGQNGHLIQILSNYEFLQCKTNEISIQTLIDDYDRTDEPDLRLIQEALRLSVNGIQGNKSELGAQLLGRLMRFNEPVIQALRAQIDTNTEQQVWLKPLTPTLTSPQSGLIRTLVGHKDWVDFVAISPKKDSIISISHDGTLKAWDYLSGMQNYTIHHQFYNPYSNLSVSDDGNSIICWSESQLKVWSVQTGAERFDFSAEKAIQQNITTAALHNNRLVIALSDGDLQYWDVDAARLVQSFHRRAAPYTTLALTCNGEKAIVGATDGLITTLYLDQPIEPSRIKAHTDSIDALTITPDHRYIISVADGESIKIWDSETGQNVTTLTSTHQSIDQLLISNNNQYLISVAGKRSIEVWDLLKLEKTLALAFTGSNEAYGVACTNNYLVCGCNDTKVRVWSLTTGQEMAQFHDHSGAVFALATTPNGDQAISGSFDHTVKIWDLKQVASSISRQSANHADWVVKLLLAPDGKQLLSLSHDATLKLWDIETGSLLRTFIGHQGGVNIACFTPNQKYLISGSDDHTLKVWDMQNGRERHTLQGHQNVIRGLAITADNRHAISGSDDGQIKIWAIESGNPLLTLTGHTHRVRAIAITTDHQYIVSGSHDKTIRIWDFASGQQLALLEGHTGPIRHITLTPDNKKIISVSDDYKIKIWGLESHTCLHTFAGHGGGWFRELTAITLLPDGNSLLAAANDFYAKVWDIETGAEKTSLGKHQDWLNGLTVTPNGKYAITVSNESLKVWDLNTGNQIDRFSPDDWLYTCAVGNDNQSIAAAGDKGNIYFLQLQSDID